MGLTKRRIGDLITVVDERNTFGIHDFYGININKEFMPTVANTEGLDETKYKVVKENRFVFSGMQTGRDVCIRISMYSNKTLILVSPAYTTFEVTALDTVIPMYFFMLFLSREKDRLGWFYSDGSIRSNLDWNRFCDMELFLPDLPTQQKYVDVYKAMVANQQSYERGLEDLKLVCDGFLDQQKSTTKRIRMGDIFQEIDNRNFSGAITDVQGINISKQFMPSVADLTDVDISRYKIVENGQFAYSGMQTGRDECIRISLYSGEKPIIISPAYSVLLVTNLDVLPEYVMMWFSRHESDRRGWFMSDASIRTNLDLPRFYEIEIPVPSLKEQQAIVEIYNTYILRRKINEKLKAQIRDICPVLIKGSLEEG